MMSKKSKKEYSEISNELLRDQVSKVIRENPKNFRSNLEKMGFTWVDDGQEECDEEARAVPENESQEYVVAYFDGHIGFSDNMVAAFITETRLEEPNYPLFRRYFKAGNSKLLHLLLSGLADIPTEEVLLSGLGYFHEYSNILSKIIIAYSNACKKEKDIDSFRALCIDFVEYSYADGYDALFELREICKDNVKKIAIIEEIANRLDKENSAIEF